MRHAPAGRRFRAATVAMILAGLVSGPAAPAPVAAGEVARGEEALDLLRERGPRPRVVRARFTQEKRLRILREPLRSSGTVTIDRPRGVVVWEIEEPDPARVVLRDDGFHVDGEKRGGSAGGWPAVVAALLTGVTSDLARHFEVRFEEPDRLHLEPRGPRLGEHVEAVDLELRSGSPVPRRIRWTEPGGDVTVIELASIEIDPAIAPEALEP